MVGCELSCENGSQGETLARMGTVLDGNHISIAVIHHGVDSRNLAIAYAVDDQVFISNVCIALIVMTILSPISNATLPVLLSVDVVDDFLGKGDGCRPFPAGDLRITSAAGDDLFSAGRVKSATSPGESVGHRLAA